MYLKDLICPAHKKRQTIIQRTRFNGSSILPIFLRYLIIGLLLAIFTLLPFQSRFSVISMGYAADQSTDAQGMNPQSLITQSNDLDSIHNKMLELAKQKKYEDALHLLTPNLLDPLRFPKIYSDYLVILVWAGRSSTAIKHFESLPDSFIKRAYLLRNMAQAYYDDKRFLTAASLYRTVLESEPSDEEAKKGLVKSLFLSGHIENALETVNRFLLKSPKSLPLLQLKADIYATQGRYLEAIKLLGAPLKPAERNTTETHLSKKVSSLPGSLEYKEQLLDDVRYSLNKGNFTAGMKYILLLTLTEDYEAAIKAVQESDIAIHQDPRYNLNDIAEAYFHSNQEQRFKYFFSAILDLNPNHVRANTGMAYYYLQADDDQNALLILDNLITLQPNDVEIRFARAFALNKAQRYWAAIQEYDQILTLLPEDRLTSELRLLTLSKMGASSYALERTIEELPDRNELRKGFIGDMAVTRLHWDESDAAMELLQPLAEVQENVEARFDYIVALAENNYFEEAVCIYEALLQQDVSTPWWLDEWIAEAYMNLRQPATALALYDQALAVQPHSFKSRIGKFYALQELRRWEKARAQLHEIDKDTPEVRVLPSFKGKRSAIVPNWTKLEVALAKGWFELYQDRLKEGQEIFENLHQDAPSDIGIRHALAHAHLWRGWPRKAFQDFNIIESMVPETEYQHRIGRIGALNQLGHKKEARREADSLLSLYPRDRHVQELVRELNVEDMHVFSTDMLFKKEDGGTQTTQIQANISKNISPQTRIYGLTLWKEVEDDSQVGQYRRGGLGVDHAFNDTFSIKQQFSAGYQKGDEFGSFTRISVNPNDYLFMDASYDSFSTDVPLQARLAGTDVQKLTTGMTYRESDWREYHLALSRQQFSDNNNRDQIFLGYEQGLYAKNDWMMRLFIDTSHSKNSLENTPYFNPRRDWTVSFTHMTQHTVWRIYDRAFVHRLYFTAGNYKQSGFSNEFVGSVRYEQEHTFSDTHALTGGVSLERNVYDGNSENSLSIHLSYRWRF
jgi:biofilm PGA synthesis protein PgaA